MNINGRNLCEHCFAEIESNSCPFCSYPKNNEKYPTALTEGTILAGRYVVGRVLGKGGFGVTYLCYDSKDRTRVAIKEYLPDLLTHRNTGETQVSTYGGDSEEYFKTGAQKFYDEAKLVSRFNGNPNIISVYEFFYENNTTYFVMEYLDGIDLKHYIKEKGGKISEEEVLYVANKITEALMIVHSTDVLHRDISPDNIFLCNDGKVKLIDFGAARQVVGEASKSLSVILKQGFAPLEQYQKRGKQGPWTDIYALGASLYYALTGEILDDAMSRIADDTLNFDGISPEFAAVLEKMLAVKIEDRYQNTFELKAALSATATVPKAFETKVQEKPAVTEYLPEVKEVIPDEKAELQNNDKKKIDFGVIAETIKEKTKEITGDSKKLKKFLTIAGAVAVVLIVIIAVSLISDGDKDEPDVGYGYIDSNESQYEENDKINLDNTYYNTVSVSPYGTIVAVKNDGTVVASGENKYGECDVSDWKDIIEVSAGARYTLGLKSDGTVISTDSEMNGSGSGMNVSGWTDIVDVFASWTYAVGIKSDGTVVVTAWEGSRDIDVSGFTDIVDIVLDNEWIIGLKSDGTLVATGGNGYEDLDVMGWSDIVSLSYSEDNSMAGAYIVGLKSDGTVVASGYNYEGQCNVSGWTDIVAVVADTDNTMGLRSDGTVVHTGDWSEYDSIENWTNIVSIAGGNITEVGLKADGTLETAGYWTVRDDYEKVSGWKNIKLPKTDIKFQKITSELNKTNNNVTYNDMICGVSDGMVTIYEYTGKTSDVEIVIPAEIYGSEVVFISEKAFSNLQDCTIVLEADITDDSYNIFHKCTDCIVDIKADVNTGISMFSECDGCSIKMGGITINDSDI